MREIESKDLNVYNFYHYVTGEQFIGTKQEFRKRYRDYDNRVRRLFLKNNSIKSWNGWTLDPDYEYARKGEYNPQADTNIYTFYNPEKQLEFTGTRYEFQDKYSLWDANLGKLFHKNAQKSLRGWTLIEDYKYTKAGLANPKADKTVYTFCHKDGDTFIGTRVDFCNKYNFKPAQIRSLFLTTNPGKSYKGWQCLACYL